MKRSRTILAYTLLAACSLMACGAVSSDGGQSGSGISAIRGDVVSVTGGGPDVANIRVSLTGTNLSARTDAEGRFELRGDASGPGELRFERESDGLSAHTEVVIPAGGVLELDQIVLDPDSGEARPTRRRVEFEGLVKALDCLNGAIFVTSKEDEDSVMTVFTVEAMSATIHGSDRLLTCSDLRVGDRFEARAETADGSTLVNADIKVEDREDDPNGEPNDQSADPPGDDTANNQGDNEPESEQVGDPHADHQDDNEPEDHSTDAPKQEDLES